MVRQSYSLQVQEIEEKEKEAKSYNPFLEHAPDNPETSRRFLPPPAAINVGTNPQIPGHLKIPDRSFPDTADPCIAQTETSDRSLMIFEQVKDGTSIVEAMECFRSRNGTTSKLTSADCGQL